MELLAQALCQAMKIDDRPKFATAARENDTKMLVEIISKTTEPVLVFCRSHICATAAMLDTRQSISDARQVTVHLLRNKNFELLRNSFSCE